MRMLLPGAGTAQPQRPWDSPEMEIRPERQTLLPCGEQSQTPQKDPGWMASFCLDDAP